MYNDMVKMAYEDIMSGFDKEAAPSAERINKNIAFEMGEGGKLGGLGSARAAKLNRAAIERDNVRLRRGEIRDAIKAAKKEKDADKVKELREDMAVEKHKRNRAILTQLNPVNHFAANTGRIVNNPGNLAPAAFGLSGALANTSSTLDQQTARNIANARLAEQMNAQKVAAYYEEAQLAKEAAEADYEVACAYEDAAMRILGELGLLED